jgi:D-serine/D-alanine/glycine transporter
LLKLYKIRLVENIPLLQAEAADVNTTKLMHVPSRALWISVIVLSAGALLSKLIPEAAFGIVTTMHN